MAEVTRLCAATPNKHNSEEDSKILKIAKLALILADKETDITDKLLCVKLGIRQGFLTEDEAAELLAHRVDLEEFMTSSDSEDN